MKTLNIAKIIDRLENSNIQVNEYKEGKKLCGYELNTYTDCGVNMIVFVDFRGTMMNPKIGKNFIDLYNQRIGDIDIEEEITLLTQDKRYMSEVGIETGYQDLKNWKENLLNIFNGQSAQQRQFEQVVDKLRSQLAAIEQTLKMMPKKGNTSSECQRTAIEICLNNLDSHINGIELEDFAPNEFSGDFKLSYS